jgi:hypothetical protein
MTVARPPLTKLAVKNRSTTASSMPAPASSQDQARAHTHKYAFSFTGSHAHTHTHTNPQTHTRTPIPTPTSTHTRSTVQLKQKHKHGAGRRRMPVLACELCQVTASHLSTQRKICRARGLHMSHGLLQQIRHERRHCSKTCRRRRQMHRFQTVLSCAQMPTQNARRYPRTRANKSNI